MIFGVYAGSAAGGNGTMAVGPPDVPERIVAALDALQEDASGQFTVRAYEVFRDHGGASLRQTPADPAQYVSAQRRLDLVVQYQSAAGDIDGYCEFIKDAIDRYGDGLASVQIGEEPNVTGNPVLDGAYPNILDAVAAGVVTAKQHAHRQGLDQLQVGVNTTPLFGPAERFLTDLAAAGGGGS